MNGYFKPWRRKLGIPTLLLACVFAAGWVRSVASIDMVLLPIADLRFVFASGSQKFRVFFVSKRVMQLVVRETVNQRSLVEVWSVDKSRFDGIKFSHNTATGGISGAYYTDQNNVQLQFIPYWSIVIPLTLLATWLLLSKPQAKIKPPITPASENA